VPDHVPPALEPVIRELRRPVQLAASFDARVMNAIRGLAHRDMRVAPGRASPPNWRVWTAFGAVAAAMLAMVFIPSTRTGPAQRVQFVLVAPDAKTVNVVGDFNGWDTAHPAFHAKNHGGGVWSVTAPVRPGYHRYAFLVDDSLWVADPSAPRVGDGDFGIQSSAIVVEQPR
jgi:hypothetical protein